MIKEKIPIIFFCSVQEYVSKCSTLMNSRDFSRLAMILIEEEEKIREIELKTTAAILIQSFWREIIFWSVRTHSAFPKKKIGALTIVIVSAPL